MNRQRRQVGVTMPQPDLSPLAPLRYSLANNDGSVISNNTEHDASHISRSQHRRLFCQPTLGWTLLLIMILFATPTTTHQGPLRGVAASTTTTTSTPTWLRIPHKWRLLQEDEDEKGDNEEEENEEEENDRDQEEDNEDEEENNNNNNKNNEDMEMEQDDFFEDAIADDAVSDQNEYRRYRHDDDFYSFDGDPYPTTLFPVKGRYIVGYVIAFLGLMLGASGGIGGGGIAVPVYLLVAGLSPKHAMGVGSVTILGGTMASTYINISRRHPLADRPLIDWDLVLVMQPVVLIGVFLGTFFHQILNDHVLVVMLVILLSITAHTTLGKAIRMFQAEVSTDMAISGCCYFTLICDLISNSNYVFPGRTDTFVT